MWTTLAKLLVVLFLRNRFNHVKSDMSEVKGHVSVYASTRAVMLKRDLSRDLSRAVSSFVAYLMMFAAIIFSGLTTIMWIVAAAMSSPNRDIILGVTVLVPLLVAIGIYTYIHKSWAKAPFLETSFNQIEEDWRTFGQRLDIQTNATPDTKS